MKKQKIAKERPEKKLVIKVPGDVKRVTTLDLIKMAALSYIERKNAKKQSAISSSSFMPDMSIMQDISFLAIVVDGEVQDVMRAQPKLTSILMAEPQFIKFDPNQIQVFPGDKYNGSEFVKSSSDLKPSAFELKKD
jgi:hypothetical protein